MLMDMSWLVCLTKYTLTIITFFHKAYFSGKKTPTKQLGKHGVVFLLVCLDFLGKRKISCKNTKLLNKRKKQTTLTQDVL